MTLRDPQTRVCTEALELLDRADRLHRQFFRLGSAQARYPSWEPPVDVFETDDELIILVALPGVDSDHVKVIVDGAALIVLGDRRMPHALQNALVRQLEIPYGHFERRIELPPGQFEIQQRTLSDGCLFLSLFKLD
ncbi:MAG: Hsp20/alpha crystallin family protein [Pseudomonadota bacterium]